MSTSTAIERRRRARTIAALATAGIDSTPRAFSGLASWVVAAVWFSATIVLALRLPRESRSAAS